MAAIRLVAPREQSITRTDEITEESRLAHKQAVVLEGPGKVLPSPPPPRTHIHHRQAGRQADTKNSQADRMRERKRERAMVRKRERETIINPINRL